MTRIITAHREFDGIAETPDEIIERMAKVEGDWNRRFLTLARHDHMVRQEQRVWMRETHGFLIRLADILAIEEHA